MNKIALIALLVCAPALATKPEPPKPTPSSTSSSVSASEAHATSKSSSAAQSHSTSKATGGNASATGGKSTSSQSQNANASNAGNSQTLNQSYEQVRQAPAVAQGSIIPPACGAGGNAGGSNSNGAGFLGFSWVTADCHRYIAAQNYLALGMPEFACAILNTTKTSKRVTKELGIALPDCGLAEKDNSDPVPTVVVIPTTGDAKDTDEKIRRAFEASQKK